MKDPYMRDEVAIVDIQSETYNTKTYTLRYIDKKLQKNFSFKPGQFILLSILGVGEAAFSLSSNPLNTKTFSTTIRKVGSFTTILDKLKPGDSLWLGGPFGTGWPMKVMKGKEILIVTGGLGILPIWPAVEVIETNKSEYGNLEILYGARSPVDCLFMDKYRHLTQIKGTCVAFTVDKVPKGMDWEYNVGLVTTLFNQMETKPKNAIVLICGPEIMMHFVIQDLLKRNFTPDQIYVSLERRMRCGFGQCGHCQIGPKFVCKDGPVFRYSEIKNLPDMEI